MARLQGFQESPEGSGDRQQAVQLEGVEAQHGKPDAPEGSRGNSDQRSTKTLLQQDDRELLHRVGCELPARTDREVEQ